MPIPELITLWHRRNQRVQLAHYESARKFHRMHLALGLPAIAVSTVVGTAVFASISEAPHPLVQLLAGLLSVTAAVLSGLQTFLKYPELAEKHRLAAAKFANLTHRIELLATMEHANDADMLAELKAIEASWITLREESPTLPSHVLNGMEDLPPMGHMAPMAAG